MKVLITTDCYIPTVNGVVTSIVNLESELRKLGHDVRILCPSQNFRCSEKGNVYRIGSISVDKLYSGARAALLIQRRHLQKIIDWKPDIIHSQTEFMSFIMAKRISAAVGCPIVHTYHTVYEDYTHYFSPSPSVGKKIVTDFTRGLLKGVRTVIVPSRKIEDLLKSYGISKKIRIVPTGLNIDKFMEEVSAERIEQMKAELNIPPENKVLVSVGRAAKEKNIDELLKYFRKLNMKNTTLLIVGGGPYLRQLKKNAKSLKLSDKVVFTGMVEPSKIAAYYKLGDVFMNASQSETQGLTYIEALASGLPMICRKDECLDEVLYNGKNGFQYTNFEQFSKYVKALINDEALRKAMAEKSSEIAQKFSNKVFAESMEKIYAETLSSRLRVRIADAIAESSAKFRSIKT